MPNIEKFGKMFEIKISWKFLYPVKQKSGQTRKFFYAPIKTKNREGQVGIQNFPFPGNGITALSRASIEEEDANRQPTKGKHLQV